MIRNFLARAYAAMAAFVKQHPAVVSWALTMGATLAARFGFHVTATTLAVLVSVLVTLLHGYIGASIRRGVRR